MNFVQIQNRIADYLNRTDLSSYIPDWINQAMRNVENDMNLPYMKKTSTALTTVAGTATYSLPSLLKRIRSFYLTVNDGKNFLYPLNDDEEETFTSDPTPSNTIPTRYSISATDGDDIKTVTLFGTPDDAYASRLRYWGFSTSLSGDTDTNWLTKQKPEILIYGACLEAEPFLMKDERINTWNAFYKKAFEELNAMANNELINQEFRTV